MATCLKAFLSFFFLLSNFYTIPFGVWLGSHSENGIATRGHRIPAWHGPLSPTTTTTTLQAFGVVFMGWRFF